MYDYAEVIRIRGFVCVHVKHNDWEDINYKIQDGVIDTLKAALHGVFLYHLSFGKTIVHINKASPHGKKLRISFPTGDFECFICGYECGQIKAALKSLSKEFKMNLVVKV